MDKNNNKVRINGDKLWDEDHKMSFQEVEKNKANRKRKKPENQVTLEHR